jgi:protein phosphatase-4 regulatory subunit 3
MTSSWESLECWNVRQSENGLTLDDPEFPTLKASYRQFLLESTKFRQVVEIKDDTIRNKIHQTYRLLYLKDVVLARVLDDPTFGILNGFVFFNQVDIINHIQSNESFLTELFADFKEQPGDAKPLENEALDERKRDIVMFLQQLMLMGKGVQVPNRLALYRCLLDRGLLSVCEWAFKRQEAQLLHATAEIVTLAVEHDVNAVRMLGLKENEANKRTLMEEIIDMLVVSRNLGLLSQMTDTMRTLLESNESEVGSRVKVADGSLLFGKKGLYRKTLGNTSSSTVRYRSSSPSWICRNWRRRKVRT